MLGRLLRLLRTAPPTPPAPQINPGLIRRVRLYRPRPEDGPLIAIVATHAFCEVPDA